MKTNLIIALVLLSILNAQFSGLFAQGTAFTYQGRLNSAGSPANGSYDLTFAFFTAASGGSPVGGVLTNAATVAQGKSATRRLVTARRLSLEPHSSHLF